jgi:ribonuclease J
MSGKDWPGTVLVVVVTISGEDGCLISGPDIIARGFICSGDSGDFQSDLKALATAAVSNCASTNITDSAPLKSAVISALPGSP